MTELPGELTGKNKEYMLTYYEEIINQLEREIKFIEKSDKELFEKSLASILGFSPSIGYQVITEYDKEEVTQVRVTPALELKKELSDYQFVTRSIEAKSSFSIHFHKFILQIRMKPMNKFTAGSMKVNCSVKYL